MVYIPSMAVFCGEVKEIVGHFLLPLAGLEPLTLASVSKQTDLSGHIESLSHVKCMYETLEKYALDIFLDSKQDTNISAQHLVGVTLKFMTNLCHNGIASIPAFAYSTKGLHISLFI